MYSILVIEDEENIRETLVDVLSMEDYDVQSAENGEEGVSLALKTIPDLIICDIMMPEMNGYEVIAELKQNPLTFAIPFLFLTAKSERKDRMIGMELGADDYITKPFQGDEILRAVKTRINKSIELKKQYQKPLEELRKNITSSLPHEMRTPLTIMLGFAHILKSGAKKLSFIEIESMAANISEAGDRLLKLIANYSHYNELLGIEAAGKEFADNLTNAPERILNDISLSVSYKYQRSDDLELNVTNQPIKINEHHFAKMIEEIVDNAFKFSEPDTPILISSELIKNFYKIDITNRGRGLRKEQIEKIGAFMQFDRMNYEQQGAGLGLAIIKKTLDLYGGNFKIDSIPDQITTATIFLPLYNHEI